MKPPAPSPVCADGGTGALARLCCQTGVSAGVFFRGNESGCAGNFSGYSVCNAGRLVTFPVARFGRAKLAKNPCSERCVLS